MSRDYLRYLFIPLLLINFSMAENIVDCRVVTANTTACNPYGSKLIKAKEIRYQGDRKKLIISKTLPRPPKAKVKVISVADMIEKYVKIEDSLRYKGTQKSPLNVRVSKKVVSKKIVQRKIKEIEAQEEIQNQKELVPQEIVKKTHPLPEAKVEKVYGFYTIENGDVLGRIANKFTLTKKELRELNHLDKKSTLRIGQKLKIPLEQKMVDSIAKAEYTVEAGDTLLSIAYRFDVDPKELVRFNKIKSNKPIRIGQKLHLPLPYILKKIEAEKERLAIKKAAELKKKKEAAKKKRLAKAKKKRVRMIRGFGKHRLRVTATAYSSHRGQTDNTPFLAAWNNRIRPGMKIIAVSRDMLTRYGLRNGSRVRIAGLRGYYTVRDKMNKRFRRRIDIYMGVNRRRALRWGRRSVMLYW